MAARFFTTYTIRAAITITVNAERRNCFPPSIPQAAPSLIMYVMSKTPGMTGMLEYEEIVLDRNSIVNDQSGHGSADDW